MEAATDVLRDVQAQHWIGQLANEMHARLQEDHAVHARRATRLVLSIGFAGAPPPPLRAPHWPLVAPHCTPLHHLCAATFTFIHAVQDRVIQVNFLLYTGM